jgi:YggT family protein
MLLLVTIIHYAFIVLDLLLIAYVVLSYFMSPFHPVRLFIDRLVNPLLAPIRRFMPKTGTIDFSPLVLILLLQLIEYVLTRLLLSIG